MNKILLPGTKYQLKFLFENLKDSPENILVIGAASEIIASEISNKYKVKINLIVDDYESFINSRISLGNNDNVNIILMDYETTDFNNDQFDLIYAQASISLTNRNKIIKEIKRVLKPRGYFCVGELVSLKKETPKFMQDIYEASNLLPLYIEDINKYYSERNFQVLKTLDLSNTLKEYYLTTLDKLKTEKEKLDEKEKAYYKKLLNRFSHESNAYLKLGGNKYLGFVSLLLQKGEA
ncbi:methyltransferase domain-containing protein [Rosettibacter firmus]|uniref:methyltransferase domain-containing protein n=1 Tax=Rosettibacter firmus TaxID=3111522 RepID=UPI00336C159E